MATFTTDLAKTYFSYSTKDASAIELNLTQALVPAKVQFKNYVGKSEYIRYTNSTDTITATSKESDNKTFNYDDDLYNLLVGDYVTVDSKMYNISAVDDGTFTIDKEYSGTELGFTNETINDYKSLFAWIVVYNFTFTDMELLLNTVMMDSETFGESTIEPADIRVRKYRKELKNNINSEYLSIKNNLGIVTRLERA